MAEQKPRIAGLYFITVNDPARGRGHLDCAKAALEGGARIIQLRDKDISIPELTELAKEMRQLTRQYGALLFINDRLDVALEVEADGVHVGQDDMPVEVIRHVASSRMLIGLSVSTVEEAKEAELAGADYLGVGCIYPTGSKDDASPAQGTNIICDIKAASKLPIIAIGGINAINVPAVLEAGADGFAVISAITAAPDMVAATKNLVTLIG